MNQFLKNDINDYSYLFEKIDTCCIQLVDVKNKTVKEQNISMIKNKLKQEGEINQKADNETRLHIRDLMNQCILDYFSSNENEKYEIRYSIFAILNDNFRDIKFISFELFDWDYLLPLIKECYSPIYRIETFLNFSLQKLYSTITNKNIKPYKIKTTNGHIYYDEEKFKKIAKKSIH